MKWVFIVLLLAVMSISTSTAGEVTGKGIKLGINIANQSSSDHFYLNEAGFGGGEKKSLVGLCVGGFVTYSLNDWFALQPEMTLTFKGAKYNEAGSSTYEDMVGHDHKLTWENEETWKLTYVEIPVLAKLNVPVQSSIRPHLLAGPAVSLKIKSKVHWQWSLLDDNLAGAADTLWEEGGKDEIEDLAVIDLNIVAGVGVDFNLDGGAKIILEVRYTMGFIESTSYAVNFSKEEWGYITRDNLAIKNRVLTFFLGYSF